MLGVVWDLSTGQETLTLKGHTSFVSSVVFTPDGKTLVSGGDRTIKLWDVGTGKNTRTLKGHRSTVFSVAISPDGKRLASGSNDMTIKIWDLATGKNVATLRGHTSQILSVVVSPDGKTLASGSSALSTSKISLKSSTIKVWNLATGKNITTFKARGGGAVCSVAFSPDGMLLASGGGGADIELRMVSTGKLLMTLPACDGSQRGVNSVVFSPNGRSLASGSLDKQIRLWRLMPKR